MKAGKKLGTVLKLLDFQRIEIFLMGLFSFLGNDPNCLENGYSCTTFLVFARNLSKCFPMSEF